MTLTQAPPKHRKRRCCEPCGTYDASQLSASIRELAVRAYWLVRAANQSGPVCSALTGLTPRHNLEFELADVYEQVVQLERRLRAQNLDSLAGYVSALRQKVGEHLA
jgi:hypothetical protein